MNFWNKMEKPILCLAPMADVTDASFRRVISKCSKIEGSVPFVTWTEFVSADGLVLAPEKGKQKLLKDLEYDESERPIVAQLFSGRPEMMEKAAYLVASLGFDGLDINMGCPDKSVEKQGAGAALIKNPNLAREIIKAAKRGVERFAEEKGLEEAIPVSVKTRLGYNQDELETWLPELLAEQPAAITIHARTRKEMSKVPARWERVKRAVEIRGGAEKTLIFGNGDVENIDEALKLAKETGCDGVMLGRAIFGNPYIFSKHEPTFEEQLVALLEHTKTFDTVLGGIKNFALMKKHFKSYLSLGTRPHTPEIDKRVIALKDALLEAKDAGGVITIISNFLSYN